MIFGFTASPRLESASLLVGAILTSPGFLLRTKRLSRQPVTHIELSEEQLTEVIMLLDAGEKSSACALVRNFSGADLRLVEEYVARVEDELQRVRGG